MSTEAGDDCGVKVVVRVRPFTPRELSFGRTDSCISVDPNNRWVQLHMKPVPKTFTFDFVAGMEVSQAEMFEKVGQPIVESCISGYNGTIFCYGQTGSGKTYTMTGFNGDYENRGLIPRVFSSLFDGMNKLKEKAEGTMEFSCKCSFLEIYNERIFDLLNTSETSTALQIREDYRQGVYVDGLSEHDVSSPEDAIRVLQQGLVNRTTAPTLMNNESSRSHSVFTIYVTSKETVRGVTKIKRGRLNLIDLAGSERQRSTQTDGERLAEACNINKSLSALGKVIMQLVDIANGKQRYVHYRDSKLTFLLRDSLGGNSKTCVVANVSPSYSNLSETLSTLQFAQRAKYIKNQPIVNEDMSGNVTALQEEIRLLKNQIAQLQQQKRLSMSNPILSPTKQSDKPVIKRLEENIVYLTNEIEKYKAREARDIQKLKALNEIIHRKDRINCAIKFLLRLKETKLAKALKREPHIEFKEFEDHELSEAQKLMKAALVPDNDPRLIHLAVENIELREIIEEYQQQFGDASETEMTRLRNVQDNLIAQIRDLICEKIQLQNLLEKVKASPDITLDEKKEIDSHIIGVDEEVKRLNAEIEQYKKDIFEAKENEKAANESKLELEGELRTLQQRVDKYKSALQQLQKDAQEAIRQTHIKSREEIQKYEEEIKRMKEEMGKLREISSQKLTEIQQRESALREANQELETQIHSAIEEREKMKELLQQMKNEMQQKEEKLAELLKDQQTSSELFEKTSSLEKIKNDLEIQLQQSLKKIEEKESQFEKTRIQLESTMEQYSQLEKQYSMLKQQNESIQKQAQDYISSMKKQFDQHIQQRNQEWQKQEQQYKLSIQQLQQQIEQIHKERSEFMSKFSAEREKMMQIIKQKDQQLEQMQSKIQQELRNKDAEIESIKKELKMVKKQSEDAEHEYKFQIENSRHQIERLLDQLSDANCKLHDTEEKLLVLQQNSNEQNELREKLEQAKLKNAKLLKTISDLESEKDKMNMRIPSYQDKINELESVIKMTKSNQEIQKRNALLEEKLSEAQLERNRYSQQVQDLKEENEIMKKRIQQMESHISKLIGHQNPKQKIQHHVKIKEENNKLKQQKVEYERQIQKLKQQIDIMMKKGGKENVLKDHIFGNEVTNKI